MLKLSQEIGKVSIDSIKKFSKSEKRRLNAKKAFTRYKNKFFLSLIENATDVAPNQWSKWDLYRLKVLRKNLETRYNIPINFYGTYIFYATYNFLRWKKRDGYKNYVGFISNEKILTKFATTVSKMDLSWRMKNSYWPEDFTSLWGKKESIKKQKIGRGFSPKRN